MVTKRQLLLLITWGGYSASTSAMVTSQPMLAFSQIIQERTTKASDVPANELVHYGVLLKYTADHKTLRELSIYIEATAQQSAKMKEIEKQISKEGQEQFLARVDPKLYAKEKLKTLEAYYEDDMPDVLKGFVKQHKQKMASEIEAKVRKEHERLYAKPESAAALKDTFTDAKLVELSLIAFDMSFVTKGNAETAYPRISPFSFPRMPLPTPRARKLLQAKIETLRDDLAAEAGNINNTAENWPGCLELINKNIAPEALNALADQELKLLKNALELLEKGATEQQHLNTLGLPISAIEQELQANYIRQEEVTAQSNPLSMMSGVKDIDVILNYMGQDQDMLKHKEELLSAMSTGAHLRLRYEYLLGFLEHELNAPSDQTLSPAQIVLLDLNLFEKDKIKQRIHKQLVAKTVQELSKGKLARAAILRDDQKRMAATANAAANVAQASAGK